MLAIELLMAAMIRRYRPTGHPVPAPIAAAIDAIGRLREPLGPRPSAAALHAALAAGLCSDVLDAAEAELPPVP